MGVLIFDLSQSAEGSTAGLRPIASGGGLGAYPRGGGPSLSRDPHARLSFSKLHSERCDCRAFHLARGSNVRRTKQC
jgi:hypothetical protein